MEHSRQESGLRGQTSGIRILALLLRICGTLHELLNLSVPQLLICKMGQIIVLPHVIVTETNEYLFKFSSS